MLARRAGARDLPSAVRYFLDDRGQTRRQIGYDAIAQQAEDPQNTIVSVKRFMGRKLADLVEPGRLPYQFDDQPGMVAVHTGRAPNRLSRCLPKSSPICVSAQKTPLTMTCLGGHHRTGLF